MVFSILIILFIGIIAFFHYVQGFFSATISAMITVIAAVLAVSYHETVVNALLKGKMADSAHAMVLCMIFAVVYIVLRMLFDAAIPGNVRTPSTVDKVGAGLMGIVAGIFVTGIFAIAVQMLPWDPSMSFLDYERYKTVGKKEIVVPTNQGRTQLDSFEYNELKDSSFTPESQQSSLIPVDDWVLDTVYHLSDGGSLAGDRSLASVHPDYLTELFGERLGIQTGAKRTTINLNGDTGADVTGLFTAASLPCFDGQIQELRLKSNYTPLYPLPVIDKTLKQPEQIGKGEVKPLPNQRILIVRVKLKAIDADDADQIVRFSTGSIHLVGKGGPDGKTYKDYFPIGTLENGSAVLLNKPDDFLFCPQDGGFDAVFVVDDSLFTGTKANIQLADGVSITIKRLADLNLSGSDVSQIITSDAGTEPQRNPLLMQRLKPYLSSLPAVASASAAPSPTPSTPVERTPARTPPPTNTNPFPPTPAPTPPANTPPPVSVPQVQAGKDIAADISGFVGTAFRAPGLAAVSTTANGNDVTDGPVAGGGTISLKDGKISAAKIDPTKSLSDINQDNSFDHFYSPTGFAMVQVIVHPYQPGWDWIGQTANTALIDANGNKYSPYGYYQLAKTGGTTGLLLRYDAAHPGPAINSPDGQPASDTYYIFLVPTNTDVKTFTMGGKTQDLSAPVHVP